VTTERTFTAEDLAQAARECAVMTALVLIRESGDAEAALGLCAEFSRPVEGDEVLDAAGVAATAIREALDMGVKPRG
jgi:hypothetical protein